MPLPVITAGMRVKCREERWYCLCGHCVVTSGELLTVRQAKHFPGLGKMVQFEEHQDDKHEPWFHASGFTVRHDG